MWLLFAHRRSAYRSIPVFNQLTTPLPPAPPPAAKKVLIVPGYGLAVANAQYAVADLVNGLRKKGIEVK